jgi:hypothetical protein
MKRAALALGDIASPHSNGIVPVNHVAWSKIDSALGRPDLDDLWIRAYFKCVNPDTPPIMIFETELHFIEL